MFITNTKSGYRRDGQGFAHGRFLILMYPPMPFPFPKDQERPKVRGLVRHVRMWQSGHYMVAFVRIKGHRIYLSGTYGSDGLINDVPQEVYDLGTDLPQELYDMWAKGGGWNSSGKEGPSMQKWGEELMKKG